MPNLLFVAYFVVVLIVTINAFYIQFVMYSKHKELFDKHAKQRGLFKVVSFAKINQLLNEYPKSQFEVTDRMREWIKIHLFLEKYGFLIGLAIFASLFIF